jgi:hypothetical protein
MSTSRRFSLRRTASSLCLVKHPSNDMPCLLLLRSRPASQGTGKSDLCLDINICRAQYYSIIELQRVHCRIIEANKSTFGKTNQPECHNTAPSPATGSYKSIWRRENRCCRVETTITIPDDEDNEEHSVRRWLTTSPIQTSVAGIHGLISIFSEERWKSPFRNSFKEFSGYILLHQNNDWISSSLRFIFLTIVLIVVDILTGALPHLPTSDGLLPTS